ncbi:MAG: histidine kinase dimerization/phospho-acceptor domain-containing protein [Verrucomicrobiota bacterium]
MMTTAYYQLEEELRMGRMDSNHPKIPGWVLHNSYAEAEIEDILGEVMRTWAWTSIPIICLSLGAGLLLARRSLRPVHDINRQLGEMRADSLHGGIRIPEADPVIANLANHLNGLLDRAGTAYQEMAEFSARVAHELRTPLMLLRMRVENAPQGIPPDFQEELQDELGRLSRFVERSLLAAKAEQGALKPVVTPVSLSDLLHDVADDYQLLAREQAISMTLRLEENIWVRADSDLLRQALHGLLENAVRYGKSEILVLCFTEAGVPIASIHNDFDPATMPPSGLGLGLRLVGGICKASLFPLEISQTVNHFTATIRFNNRPNDPTTP